MLTHNGNDFDIFEIKSSQTIMTEQFKAMNYFSTPAENKINKMTLIYGGRIASKEVYIPSPDGKTSEINQ